MWLGLILVLGLVITNPSECVVEEYINASVSPCEDFHQYACGRWADVNRNVEHGDTLSLLDEAMNQNVAKYLAINHDKQGALSKMKTFYSSCMNIKDYKLNGFLDEVKPRSGWAAFESSWKSNDFDWLDTIAELRRYAFHVFLEQTVMPKWDNTKVNIIYLDVVKVNPSSWTDLVAILQGTGIDREQAEIVASELVKFEQQLPRANETVDTDDSEEVVLGYLSESLPQVNWVKYLSIVYGEELDAYTPLIVQNTEVMSKLVAFLNRSPSKIVCNYIMVKFLQFLKQHSIDEVSSNDCITALHQSMPLAMSYVIEHNFYDPEFDQMVQDLLNFLKVEFLAEAMKLYEKQQDVLLFLYTKTSVMELQIGNAKRNLTLDDVSKYYENLQFENGRFYQNLLSAFKFKESKELNSIRGTSVEMAHQWTVTPSPFFVQPKNRIVVPLSLLQEAIVGKDFASKYSILGFIIGHEFLHGFDVNGINYDYEGSMGASAVSQSPAFQERVQCVEKQLEAKGIGEKIADLGGIRLAFYAYRRSLSQIGRDIARKEGAGRSLGQNFFIEFAQFFCGTSKKQVKGFTGPDVHDADELRVAQSVKNFDEFAKAFECKAGLAMNPVQKCRVW